MITHSDACTLIEGAPEALPELLARAGELRDRGRGRVVTFSAKVFVPLTTLCRDYCGYCTFRRDPGEPGAHTLTPEEVVALVQAGARLGAKEALFSLGDKPEARFPEHREFLRRHGHRTTLSYLRAMCALTLGESSLLPHANPGCDGERDLARCARSTSAWGSCWRTLAIGCSAPGLAHDNAPDKVRFGGCGRSRWPASSASPSPPASSSASANRRASASTRSSPSATCTSAGPHPEVIIQNFRAKPASPCATPRAHARRPAAHVAVARLLSARREHPGAAEPDARVYPRLLRPGSTTGAACRRSHPTTSTPRSLAGLRALRDATEAQGFDFRERLAIYPEYATRAEFLDERCGPGAALIDPDRPREELA